MKTSEVRVNEIIARTDKAALCDLELQDERKSFWVPYSQCADLEDYDLGDGQFKIQIPNWLLIEKGMLTENPDASRCK